MIDNLARELDFVGSRKRLPWFTRNLTKKTSFVGLVEDIQEKRSETSLRNILYSLLPISEYVASLKKGKFDRTSGEDEWIKLLEENAHLIRHLAVKYGTQGNIPQRAAIILDYFYKSNLLSNRSATVVELGCSAGLIGTVLCSSETLFLHQGGSLAKEYFWLKRMPRVRSSYNITYRGYDRTLPLKELIPFFVWDVDKRHQVSAFVETCPEKGVLFEKTFEEALEDVSKVNFEAVIILTSFVLYQLTHPEVLIDKIMELVYNMGNVHWLDLSRNDGLPCLFQRNTCVPGHVYLSHNGTQVAHVINGSDDCPDWEYMYLGGPTS
ncbi:MAG: hypothetical protein UU98_C0007G0054 [Parcubacteria group bacterium GW2011_GWD2_42_14]|nr:MAG: hypothetical protein UU98_C0007G0054 [Parcubacteria group bacterium GW2011_GWD2_42_14]